MPTLRQLEYLIAVADTGHFGRAAERVRVSQPTLSEQLKTLEQRLGVQLVERTRGRVRFTGTGFELAEIGRGMLRDAQQIRGLAERHRRKLDGSICVGLLQTIGPPLLSRILPALCAKFPQLTLRISEDVPQALLSGLDTGIFDVVLAPLDGRPKAFEHAEIFQEPIYLCLPTGHPLTKRKRVRPADLRGVQLLSLAPRHQLHDVAAELAAKLGAKLRVEYEINNLDTLREMIAAKLGASFLPGLYVDGLMARDRSFKIVEIEGWPAFALNRHAVAKELSRKRQIRGTRRFCAWLGSTAISRHVAKASTGTREEQNRVSCCGARDQRYAFASDACSITLIVAPKPPTLPELMEQFWTRSVLILALVGGCLKFYGGRGPLRS